MYFVLRTQYYLEPASNWTFFIPYLPTDPYRRTLDCQQTDAPISLTYRSPTYKSQTV